MRARKALLKFGPSRKPAPWALTSTDTKFALSQRGSILDSTVNLCSVYARQHDAPWIRYGACCERSILQTVVYAARREIWKDKWLYCHITPLDTSCSSPRARVWSQPLQTSVSAPRPTIPRILWHQARAEWVSKRSLRVPDIARRTNLQ